MKIIVPNTLKSLAFSTVKTTRTRTLLILTKKLTEKKNSSAKRHPNLN